MRVAELTHGANRSIHREDNLARLEVLLSALIILLFDESAARRFGILKAELEKRGELNLSPKAGSNLVGRQVTKS